MTGSPREQTLLVCVYYRVAGADAEHAISAVREFQRTLRRDVHVLDAEVLLRCGLPPVVAASPAPLADPPHRMSPAPVPAPASVPAFVPTIDPPAAPSSAPVEATLMETYRIALPAPAGTDVAQAAVRHFLDGLEASASSVATLLRGARHVELFASCAS
jgi:hypothetical protein